MELEILIHRLNRVKHGQHQETVEVEDHKNNTYKNKNVNRKLKGDNPGCWFNYKCKFSEKTIGNFKENLIEEGRKFLNKKYRKLKNIITVHLIRI